jgi:predicted Zn-dependent protease
MIYDDDPAQGIVDGQTFRHPGLKLQFTAPAGFAIANSPSAVTVGGTGGQAQFGGGRASGDLASYVQDVFRSVGVQSGVSADEIRLTRINGIEAARAITRANTSSGQVDVGVVAYRPSSGGAYHFVTLTRAGAGFGPFAGMVDSVARLSDAAAAAIRPRRVRVVTVAAGDTIASLAAKMAYSDFRVERFRTLNALAADARLVPGQKVKLIVRG